jgi:galactitol PTS system EIIB component
LDRKKRVLVVCGTAIATSTVVAMKLDEILKKNGVNAEIRRCMTSEAKTASRDVDLIVSTTQVPGVSVPVISGIPFITGVGSDRVAEEVVQRLRG